MSHFEALILGILQGLTEFLPVSSSGHLAIGQELFGVNSPGVLFEVVLHTATVLSTIIVFRKEILGLLSGLFKFELNYETRYIFNIAISMIPVLIIGIFFKDYVEQIFGSGLTIVGISLLVTSALLFLTTVIKPGNGDITPGRALIVGIAQAIAVLPGLSRSGATISAGLLSGVKREEIAKFSFLMVLVPILGEAFLSIVSGEISEASAGIGLSVLFTGFVAAFVSGLFACKIMINIVKRVKLTAFAIYCALAGILALALL